MKKTWTILDELKVLALYKDIVTPARIAELAKEIKKTEDSVKMKLSNFCYLDKGYGLANCSKQSIEVMNIFGHSVMLDDVISELEEKNGK